jgi:hypothetical protein
MYLVFRWQSYRVGSPDPVYKLMSWTCIDNYNSMDGAVTPSLHRTVLSLY